MHANDITLHNELTQKVRYVHSYRAKYLGARALASRCSNETDMFLEVVYVDNQGHTRPFV